MSKELKLLPCFNPECGCKNAIIHMAVIAKKNMWFVECIKDACSMHGPAKFTEEEAIAAWNALPRSLTWTTEPPKVDGNYWWKCEQEQPDVPQMVNVTMYPDGEYSHHFHYGSGPYFHECDLCQWAGPIPMPKDPTP